MLTLYLLPAMMLNLRSKIFNELNPARAWSHMTIISAAWSPDDQISFDVPEKESVTGVPKATVLLWFVPARVAGTWEVKTAAGDTYQVALNQRFQVIDGTASAGGRPVKAQNLTLRGNDISFALPDAKGQARFTGRINGDAMEGTVESPGRKAGQRWTATRTAAGKVVISRQHSGFRRGVRRGTATLLLRAFRSWRPAAPSWIGYRRYDIGEPRIDDRFLLGGERSIQCFGGRCYVFERRQPVACYVNGMIDLLD